MDGAALDELFTASRRGSREEWARAFESIVAQVSARVRCKFRDSELAESAALSAARTCLSRVRRGEDDQRLYRVEGPDALLGYLVLIAHGKAWEKLRARTKLRRLPEGYDPEDLAESHDDDPGDWGLINRALTLEMEAQVSGLLDRVESVLPNDLNRRVFRQLFLKKYAGEKMTDGEIAARERISERTVRRIRQKSEPLADDLVAEARVAVRSLELQLVERADL
jgi:DNA-directed RNA polymerase specialized sigma24 family protein